MNDGLQPCITRAIINVCIQDKKSLMNNGLQRCFTLVMVTVCRIHKVWWMIGYSLVYPKSSLLCVYPGYIRYNEWWVTAVYTQGHYYCFYPEYMNVDRLYRLVTVMNTQSNHYCMYPGKKVKWMMGYSRVYPGTSLLCLSRVYKIYWMMCYSSVYLGSSLLCVSRIHKV